MNAEETGRIAASQNDSSTKPISLSSLDSRGSSSSWVDDPEVAASLEEFLSLMKAGKAPDRSEFLARHAHIAGVLADCLDGLEFVQSAARRLDPADSSSGNPAEEEAPPEEILPLARLGDYQIIREVGRGGMGVVYEAEQISLGRRVALKVLPFAVAIDPRKRRRFQVEAQAAGHLHHPHIVPVHAVGRDGGVNYYAMQFIEGRTLAAVIRELKDSQNQSASTWSDADFVRGEKLLSGRSKGSLDSNSSINSPSDSRKDPSGAGGIAKLPSTTGSSSSQRSRSYFQAVARLGGQAAEALDHAHGLGVLHRDVKPANLMVDSKGDLWITDFGLARFQEDEGLTRTGDLMGTLRYMSPEQSQAKRGVVDQRTDIYSLGVTLYELLTLRAAFDAKDRAELMRQILLDDPPAPRRINPAIPRDLETIVLKAMSKDVAGRYATAKEMAEDLQRFLQDQPVKARRATLPEHLAKWTRRHRSAVTAASVVFLASLAVGAGLLLIEKGKTEEALKGLQAIRDREREHLPEVLSLSGNLTMEAMGVVAMAGQANQEFYQRAAKAYEGVIKLSEDDPMMRSITGMGYHHLAFAKMVLRKEETEENFLKAVAIFKSLAEEFPDEPDHRAQLAKSYEDLAMHLGSGMNRAEDADRYTDTACRIRREIVLAAPLEPEAIKSYLSHQQNRIGRFRRADKHEEAAKVVKQLEEDHDVIAEKLHAMPDWIPGPVTHNHHEQGSRLVSIGRRVEAEMIFRLGIRIDPEDMNLYNDLAWLYVSMPSQAPFDPVRGAAFAVKAVEAYPKNWAYWNTLGVARLRLGELEAATDALNVSMKLHGGSTPIDWLYLAVIEKLRNNPDKAGEWYARAEGWINAQQSLDIEVAHAQTEAAAALGLPTPKQRVPLYSSAGGLGLVPAGIARFGGRQVPQVQSKPPADTPKTSAAKNPTVQKPGVPYAPVGDKLVRPDQLKGK